jgi:hypothetical protein
VPLHGLAIEFVEAEQEYTVVDDAEVGLHGQLSDRLSDMTIDLTAVAV